MRTLFIAATILVPASALAGGYVIPNENARDLALSQSAVAAQTGAEAVFLNTAALAGQEGLDISVAGELLVNRTTWSDPTGDSANLIPQTNLPPTAAISYGHKLSNGMAWGIGLGFGVPAGGSLVWPNGWAGQESIQSVSQKVYMFGGGAALQLLPGIKLGAAYLRYQVQEELHQSVNYLDHYGDAGIALTGGTNSFELAAEIAIPHTPITLAATYKHSGNTTLEGDAHFVAVPPAFQTLLHDQAVTEKMTIPAELYVGAAVKATSDLTIMGAYNWEKWDTYKADVFVGASGFTVTVPRNYNNAHVYRVGAEWRMPFMRALTVRAGGLRSVSEQPTSTLSPSLTDASSWGISAGAGINVVPNVRIDFGYQRATFDQVTATGIETLPGSYNTIVQLFSVGLNWRTDLGMGTAPAGR